MLETIPLVMQAIRGEMRRHRSQTTETGGTQPDLSVPQFRTLAFLYHYSGSSLSEAAGHVGLTLSSMSRMIDGLVGRSLITRATSPDDRRTVRLKLTPGGKLILRAAERAAQSRLADLLEPLPENKRIAVARAMRTLRRVFTKY